MTLLEPTDSLRIVTWNIRAGVRTSPVSPHNPDSVDLAHVASILEDLACDVICLQEVDWCRGRTGHVDQSAWLADRLGMRAEFAPNLIVPGDGEYGTTVLSRLEMVDIRHVRFPVHGDHEPRGMQVIDVATIVSPLRVINTHLQVDHLYGAVDCADERSEGLAMARDAAGDGPSLIVGDFNAGPGAAELDRLQGFLDCGVAAGMTVEAHPIRPATRRIDYVYASEGIQVVRAAVPYNARTRSASDHLPVVVDLSMQGTP